MDNDFLLVDGVFPAVQAKIAELATVIKKKTLALKGVPQGNLRVAMRGDSYRFFHVTEDSLPNGRFIIRENQNLAVRLAQRDYDSQVLALAKHQKEQLERFSALYKPNAIDDVFARQSSGRQSLITPIRLSDDEFKKRWLAVSYEGKAFSGDTPFLRTARGERVRSKSEVIIADTLAHYGVPYRYEFPHVFFDRSHEENSEMECLKKKKKVNLRKFVAYPDFTCVNVRTRQEFLWEHFGLMDKPDYAMSAVHKREVYEENGFFAGQNAIFTEETSEQLLDSARVNRLVERFLL